MLLTRWLRPLRPPVPVARPHPAGPRRLRVECLEDRTNPGGGELDPTFGVGGSVLLPNATADIVQETVVQPDGKIVAVGTAHPSLYEYQPSITRLNPDGSLDTSFGTGGTVKLKLPKGTTGRVYSGNAVDLQPDGKILVGVSSEYRAETRKSSADEQFAVARLNPNGSLDTSFGNKGGWWLANTANLGEEVQDLAVVPAGDSFSIYVGCHATGFTVARLTPAGLPDPTYGSGGFAVLQVPSGIIEMAVAPNGTAVIVGTSYIGVFSPAGLPDTSFNGTGYVETRTTTPSGIVAYQFKGVAIQGDNIVVAGVFGATGVLSRGCVARYTMSGTLDPTFGTDGVYFTPAELAPLGGYSFHDLTVGADGSISLVGATQRRNESDPFQPGLLIGHLSADGLADVSFGTDGNGLINRPDLHAYTLGSRTTLTLDASGNLLVSGRFGTDFSNSATYQGYVLRLTRPQ